MAKEKSRHILIVGTGAVGAFYGSRLHQSAQYHLVSLVCRSNYKAIHSRDDTVQLKTRTFGDYSFKPHAVFDSVKAAAASETLWDYLVVTTKALPDVTDDSVLIEPLVDKTGKTCIVLIQNEVGVELPYRQRFPKAPIVSGVTVISAEQTEPGVIVQNRWTRISLGPFGTGEGTSESTNLNDSMTKTNEFAEILATGGIKDAEPHDETDLQLIRWHKLAINASMNPSAVLSGGTGNSRMSLDPELRIHLKGCMEELFNAVPKILGRPFPPSLATPDKILTSTERNTAGKPSMLLDWERQAPMELEVILGNPVRIARSKGIDLPRMQSLYALLKMAQTRRRETEEESSTKSKL